MEKRLCFEEINVHWTWDNVESEVAIGLILIGEISPWRFGTNYLRKLN